MPAPFSAPLPSPSTPRTTRLFHIFYTTLFYLLYLALLGLILITPGDAIHQALQNRQLYNVFVIAAAYFVTAFLAVLIYASRVYTTRSVLQGIPRGWVPVEEGEVEERVRKVIGEGLGRSAAVSWLSRPRVGGCVEGAGVLCLTEEIEERREHVKEGKPKLAKRVLRKLTRRKGPVPGSRRASDSHTHTHDPVRVSQVNTVEVGKENGGAGEDHGTHIWGHITHPGWSPPTASQIPNLHYHPVISELPHLVEAKVVSLSGAVEENIALLTRPVSAGLREYLYLLGTLGCLDLDAGGDEEEEDGRDGEDKEEGEGKGGWKDWLVDYEYARFSGQPVTEDGFRELMSDFATLLHSLRGLDGQVAGDDEEGEVSDWDEGEAYSVFSKSSLSTPSQGSLKSKTSRHSFATADRRSVRTTGTAGTAGTVEKRDMAETGPQMPSYLSSPLPHTPSPRQKSFPTDAQPYSYEMQDMANTPESFARQRQQRSYPPPHPHHHPPSGPQIEMQERVRLGPNGGEGVGVAVTESLRSFETDGETDGDGGSVVRHLSRADEGEGLVGRMEGRVGL